MMEWAATTRFQHNQVFYAIAAIVFPLSEKKQEDAAVLNPRVSTDTSSLKPQRKIAPIISIQVFFAWINSYS